MATIRTRAHDHHHAHDGHEHLSPIELLKRGKLRSTPQRREILEKLSAAHGPESAQAIHARLRKGLCDLVTVYRCLEVFEKAEIVSRVDFSDGIARFEIAHPGDHHHHLICTKCRSVRAIEMDHCPLEEIAGSSALKGFQVQRHTLEVFGLCKSCHK
jgi:Fur family ferric uptake transcriptional regulator